MTLIYAMPVPEHRRVECTGRRFGPAFSFRLEPTIYGWASRLADSYDGGYWDFNCLSNGGFFMAPASDRSFEVAAPNGYTGTLTAEALGIAACLYAYSHGSFGEDATLADACAVHYHQLREYALQHAAAGSLMAVID